MKTTSNKMAVQAEEKKVWATQPCEPQPIEQPLVRVEITPLTTWEAIADKAQGMEKIWEDILPYAHFSIDIPINDESLVFLWEDIRELLDRFHHGEWNAKADWWHYVVVEAIFNHIMADMGYLMMHYEEKNKSHGTDNSPQSPQ